MKAFKSFMYQEKDRIENVLRECLMDTPYKGIQITLESQEGVSGYWLEIRVLEDNRWFDIEYFSYSYSKNGKYGEKVRDCVRLIDRDLIMSVLFSIEDYILVKLE